MRSVAQKAYWILRYRPLRPKSPIYWDKPYDVNVYFAFYMLLAATIGECFVARSESVKDQARAVVNDILQDHEDDYSRAFSEYDISKEAMMLITDNLRGMINSAIR